LTDSFKVTAFPCDEDLKAWLGLRAGRELFVKVSAFHDAEAKVALLGDSAAGMYSSKNHNSMPCILLA